MQKGRRAEEQIGRVSKRLKSRGADGHNWRETKEQQIGKGDEMPRGREAERPFSFLLPSFFSGSPAKSCF